MHQLHLKKTPKKGIASDKITVLKSRITRTRRRRKQRNQIDIKGAITLAITVTSFLLVLTFMETTGRGMAGSSSFKLY